MLPLLYFRKHHKCENILFLLKKSQNKTIIRDKHDAAFTINRHGHQLHIFQNNCLFPPTVGVELPHKATTASGFPPAHTRRDRSSPVVTVFSRFHGHVADSQLLVTPKNGSDHILIPNSSEMHAIQGANFF